MCGMSRSPKWTNGSGNNISSGSHSTVRCIIIKRVDSKSPQQFFTLAQSSAHFCINCDDVRPKKYSVIRLLSIHVYLLNFSRNNIHFYWSNGYKIDCFRVRIIDFLLSRHFFQFFFLLR